MSKTMGERIAEIRKEKGMTQKELAEQLNITDKAVSKWERDLSCPDIGTLPKLAEVLGIRVEELLNTAEPEQPRTKTLDATVDMVLKALPLAMGVALVTVSILKKDLDVYTIAGLTGIGLFSISLYQLRHE
jgi:transcriptional regulator with XRE-family HTH domain